MASLEADKQKQYVNRRRINARRRLGKLRYHLLCRTPGTSHYRFRQVRKVMKLVYRRRESLEDITAFSPEYKAKIWKKLLRSEFNLTYVRYTTRDLLLLILFLVIIISFFLSISSAIIIWSLGFRFNSISLPTIIIWFFGNHFLDNEFIFVSVLFLLGFLLTTIITLTLIAIYEGLIRINKRLAGRFLIAWPIISVFIGPILLYENFSYPYYIPCFLFFLLFYISYSSTLIVTIHRKILFMIIYPLETMVNTTLALISELEKPQNIWIILNNKQDQLLKLEEIAKCIERYLPRRLRSSDIVTDVWLKTTTKEIATYIREKKRWILTPKEPLVNNFHNY